MVCFLSGFGFEHKKTDLNGRLSVRGCGCGPTSKWTRVVVVTPLHDLIPFDR